MSTKYHILFGFFLIGILSCMNPNNEKKGFTAPAKKTYKSIKEIRAKWASKRTPEDWMSIINKCAPHHDWRALESNSITNLLNKRGSIHSRSNLGRWIERGPSNIPGRITDLTIDYGKNQIYALADHGVIFKSENLKGDRWKALNDQFPLAIDVAGQLKNMGNGKLVVSGWQKVKNDWGVYFSIDDGQNWQHSAGIAGLPIMGIKRMIQSDQTLLLLVQEYDFEKQTDYYTVYKSIDEGRSFSILNRSKIPVGDGGRHRKSDMWMPEDDPNSAIYLSIEDSLFTVNSQTGAREFQSIISGLAMDQALLTGAKINNIIYLHAYVAVGEEGKFYSWRSDEKKWTYQGEMTEGWRSLPFGFNSFTCSKLNPAEIYFGAILISKSTDYGKTWELMDMDPTNSYALYHGDVPKVLTSIHPNSGKEELHIGTDGGIYKLDQNKIHFQTISVPGLNCTQIYKMITEQDNPGSMYIGTQDNGYCHTDQGLSQQEAVDFKFQWGGDVTSVGSGDGGKTFWLWWLGDGCNYMAGPDEVISTWTPYEHSGRIPYWEAPIWISNHFPDRCYTAGAINGQEGNYLIKLKAKLGERAQPEQNPFNFEVHTGGGIITAIAISPIDSNYVYVATSNGKFLHSKDAGETWTSADLAPYFYARFIFPSSLRLGEIIVGGSGYSNSALFKSTNHGQQFQSFSKGLPALRAEKLASNEDETTYYLATSIAPFVLENGEDTWKDLVAGGAPINQYMDVQYLPKIRTVRFATYARGIWDFALEATNANTDFPELSNLKIYPNPASDELHISNLSNCNPCKVAILDPSGRIVQRAVLNHLTTKINVANLIPGIYFLSFENRQTKMLKFVINR